MSSFWHGRIHTAEFDQDLATAYTVPQNLKNALSLRQTVLLRRIFHAHRADSVFFARNFAQDIKAISTQHS